VSAVEVRSPPTTTVASGRWVSAPTPVDGGDGNADRGGTRGERGPPELHSFAPRSRSAFPITDTEERLIAALAIIGLRSSANQG
jgi:hypothetical protein